MNNELENAVNTLPKTVGAIADHLAAVGVRGVRFQETCCPMARYLRQVLEVPYASVDVDTITVITGDGYGYGMETPTSVIRFMTRFDDGDFEDLVDVNGPTDEELHTIEQDTIPERDLIEAVIV